MGWTVFLRMVSNDSSFCSKKSSASSPQRLSDATGHAGLPPGNASSTIVRLTLAVRHQRLAFGFVWGHIRPDLSMIFGQSLHGVGRIRPSSSSVRSSVSC